MRIRLLLAVPLLLLAMQASAQTTPSTQTNEVRVSILINDTCSFDAPDIDFSTVDAGQATVDPVTRDFSVLCSLGTAYTLGLDGGNSEDVAARQMWHETTGNEDTISYSLSQGSQAGTNWGNTAGAWVSSTGGGLTPADPNQHQVFAQATLTGEERAGSYEDTVLATLTF